MRRIFGLGLALIGVISAAPARQADHAATSCWRASFEGDGFLVCRYDGAIDTLRLMHRGADGHPANLAEVETSLGADATRLRFAMNAGMYHPDHRPVGLFIAGGRTVQSLERAAGTGNFYLRPNGVFWIDEQDRPHVDETEAFAARSPDPVWATQSGPLLLAAGALHPAISADGPSRTMRNAVGIAGGQALFVISEGPVSFGRLARFFRDELGCSDALYLDGTVSSLWAPALGRKDRGAGLATFLVVLKR